MPVNEVNISHDSASQHVERKKKCPMILSKADKDSSSSHEQVRYLCRKVGGFAVGMKGLSFRGRNNDKGII